MITDVMSHFFPDITNFRFYNAVILQRQCLEHQRKYLEEVIKYRNASQNHKFRIIYDCDDLFHDIPAANLAKIYFSKENIDNMLWIMKSVDACSFSTPFLKQYYEKLGVTNTQLIPNAIPKYLWDLPKRQGEPYNKKEIKILWAGSPSHHGKNNDTEIIEKVIEKLNRSFGDRIKWIFFGTPPTFFKQDKNMFLVPWKQFFAYPKTLYKIYADIGIIPLVTNDFNFAKSDIKLLEFSACGIPTVFSSIGEYGPYGKAPLVVKNEVNIWVESIVKLIEDPKYYNEIREKQYQYIQSRWMEGNIKLWFDFITGQKIS